MIHNRKKQRKHAPGSNYNQREKDKRMSVKRGSQAGRAMALNHPFLLFPFLS